MKNLLILTVLIATLNLFAHAPFFNVDTKESKGVISNVDFAPLQVGVGFFENAQLYDGKVSTFISFGLLGLMQHDAVISFAPVNGIKNNYGLHCGLLMAVTEKNYFLSTSFFNASECNYGLQLGVENFALDHSMLQIGAVNLGNTMQVGLYNIGGKIQCGIVNVNGNFQLGLLNYNPNAWIKWMPLFNFSFSDKEDK